MFRSENPFTSAKSLRRSRAKRGITPLPPTFVLLPLGDGSTDVPIQADQFRIDCERGPNLGGADAMLDIREKRRIVRRHIGPVHAMYVRLFAGHDRSIPRSGPTRMADLRFANPRPNTGNSHLRRHSVVARMWKRL
jgi:hypothetical protein